LHNEELHNSNISPNIIRVIKSRRTRWVGHTGCMEVMRNAYKISFRKCERKRPLRRPRHRWEDTGMAFREIMWKDVTWIHLAQERDKWQVLVNMVINLQVP
jgi:hypothetical protein